MDDLLENFFIRLVRGSVLRGLTSLGKKSEKGQIKLHRPLLDQKKSDLIKPINNIEKKLHTKLIWRNKLNNLLKNEYKKLFKKIDKLNLVAVLNKTILFF